MIRLYFTCLIVCTCYAISYSQIVTTDPIFPTQLDDITIYYDATQGSAGLVGEEQVYIHTGIITESGGPGNWMNVQGNWGTDDENVKMTNEGNDIHSISFNITDYYGVSGAQTVTELGMVFRNVDGSKEGKTSDFNDIFVPIYSENSDLLGKFIQPFNDNFILNADESLDVEIAFSKEADVIVKDNEDIVFEGLAKDVSIVLENLTVGSHILSFTGIENGITVSDAISFVVNPAVLPVGNEPDDVKWGLTKIDATTVRLKLYAPYKDFIYVLGNFNEYKPTVEGLMTKSINSTYYWIDIENINPEGAITYQYWIDGELKIADPYSTLVLDDFHDQFITESTYPSLPEFPENTDGRVSYFSMQDNSFDWTDDDFEKPAQTELNIYELLMRDFLQDHSYTSLKDTLTYLKKLGINAIELMPIQEFEGNDSWGYNPSFHMAIDKYYGTAEQFKEVVNTAHEMGIAVILDVVYNHAFSQNPYVQMYWENNQPSEQSPFFNQEAKHPFNVGYDMNHESAATNEYVKQINEYWINEYHIDGFRFDLSKGFTQKMSFDNSDFATYDPTRVAILTEYANHIWDIDPSFYVILEHFAANNEEEILSNSGMMLWNNANHVMNEATMGYTSGSNSNFDYLSYKVRGWDDPHAVGYIESHDEERLQYKNLNFGNSASNYSTKDPETAYDRNAMAAVFFFTIPGPKMIWQFGELGYDYSINRCENGTISDGCRLSPKPIRWDFLDQQGRADQQLVYSAMMNLRNNEETKNTMHTSTFALDVSGTMKRISLSNSDKDVYLIGNFGLTEGTIPADFSHTGTWYDFFSEDSINVVENMPDILLQAGEYRMYWDKKIQTPQLVNHEEVLRLDFNMFPNPTSGSIAIESEFGTFDLAIYSITGHRIFETEVQDGTIRLDRQFPAGIYIVQIYSEGKVISKKLIVE